MLKNIFLVVAFFCAFQSIGQVKFSSDPAKFITEVNTMFNASNSAPLKALNTEFAAAWTGMDGNQQKKLIELSQKMAKTKKFKASNYGDLFGAVLAAKTKNVPAQKVDSLLIITDLSLDKLVGKQIFGYLTTVRLFLESDYVYKSSYNSLKVSGGSFSFQYKSADQAPVVNELPAATDTAKVDPAGAFSDWDISAAKVDENWGSLPADPANGQNTLDVGYTPPPQPVIDGPIISFQN
ncbi:MAG TPA: hypothetical protein VF691_16500, partial [Cytophagaceae bacterium]